MAGKRKLSEKDLENLLMICSDAESSDDENNCAEAATAESDSDSNEAQFLTEHALLSVTNSSVAWNEASSLNLVLVANKSHPSHLSDGFLSISPALGISALRSPATPGNPSTSSLLDSTIADIHAPTSSSAGTAAGMGDITASSAPPQVMSPPQAALPPSTPTFNALPPQAASLPSTPAFDALAFSPSLWVPYSPSFVPAVWPFTGGQGVGIRRSFVMTTPLEFFHALFPIALLTLIASETNCYATQNPGGGWKATTEDEIGLFISLVLLMTSWPPHGGKRNESPTLWQITISTWEPLIKGI